MIDITINGWTLRNGAIARDFGPWVTIVLSAETEGITIEVAEESPLGSVRKTLSTQPSPTRAEKIGDHLKNALATLAELAKPAPADRSDVTPTPKLQAIDGERKGS